MRGEIHEVDPDFRKWLQAASNQGFFQTPHFGWMAHYTAVMDYVEKTYLPALCAKMG